jgi:hypothetical protein
VLVLVAIGVFMTQFIWVPTVLVDDAYITFSFSKNLAAGNGPVFSHGVRDEGYSNFLWMVLVALPLVVAKHASPLLVARAVATPFLLAAAISVYRLTSDVTRSRWAAALSVCLVAASTDLAIALLSGLESVAYTGLVTVGLSLYVIARRRERFRPFVIPVLVAAALTRIDGFVPLLLVVAWECATVISTRPRDLPKLVRWCGPGLCAYAAWFGWRWLYYGLFLPSTYYAKASIPILLPLRGLEYVWGELTGIGLLMLAAAMGMVLWARRAELLPVVAFAIVQLAYAAKVGGDWMPWGRFVMPAVPSMIVLFVVAGVEAARRLARSRVWVRWPAYAILVAAYAAVGLGLDHRVVNTPEEDRKLALVAGQIDHVRSLRRAAALLSFAVPAGGRLVTDYPGIFSVYTDAAIIDMWGLCTSRIAQFGTTEGVNPIYGKTCPSCYPGLDPEFFHVMQPIVRTPGAFATANQVIASVWQTDTIGRYIDFRRDFAVGRVTRESSHEGVFFLERRRPSFSASLRVPTPGIQIDYPFEPSPGG